MLKTLGDLAVAQVCCYCTSNDWESELIEGSVIRQPDVRDCYVLNAFRILLGSPNVNHTAQRGALRISLPCPLGSLKDVASCLSSKVSAVPQEKSLLYSLKCPVVEMGNALSARACVSTLRPIKREIGHQYGGPLNRADGQIQYEYGIPNWEMYT